MFTDSVEETVDGQFFLVSCENVLDAKTLEKIAITQAFRRDSIPQDGLGFACSVISRNKR